MLSSSVGIEKLVSTVTRTCPASRLGSGCLGASRPSRFATLRASVSAPRAVLDGGGARVAGAAVTDRARVVARTSSARGIPRWQGRSCCRR